MIIEKEYELWLKNATEDNKLIEELKAIKNNESEKYERFYQNLKFGTAGLRGILGAGSNRMNIYVVRKATQGLANYLNKKYKHPSVAISYDSRINSELFSKEAAKVLVANNIKVYITSELAPTPFLSYMTRFYSCSAGIMITASHNPAEYNGYKCYGSDGCQMTDHAANKVYEEIEKLDLFKDVLIEDYNTAVANNKIEIIGDSVYKSYLNEVLKQSVNKNICKDADLKVVYTPLNGAGNKLVRNILNTINVTDVTIVKEQENPDGNFTTCPYPNPEFKEALELGLNLSKEINADLLLATDPDSDRVGIAVKNGDTYRLISGNEVGIMLTEYLLSSRKKHGTLPEHPVIVKTIVSSILTEKVAADYGCRLINVLTGFKYIGEQILLLEKTNEENNFVLGFEESYGYLAGTYVRDKDAVVASMLICEMASYYKKQGKTLSDVIDDIYKKYGFYKNVTLNYQFEGSKGFEKMNNLMLDLRHKSPTEIGGFKVKVLSDYLGSFSKNIETGKTDIINLPKSNVLSYLLDNDNSVIIRPSGTEPKIKVYITSVGETSEKSDEISKILQNAISNMIN